jgi:hypothetical protein
LGLLIFCFVEFFVFFFVVVEAAFDAVFERKDVMFVFVYVRFVAWSEAG